MESVAGPGKEPGGDDSVSQWIAGLRAGEAEAARRLWERYARELVRVVTQQLGNAPRRMADEDDVAQSVFRVLCRGAAAGRFADLANRDELWWLLLRITEQKAIDYKRREKRGGGCVAGEAEFADETGRAFARLVDREPTPEMVAMLGEQHERLLGLLGDDELKAIANWRIEGYTVEEIAERLQVAPRTVKRRLNLIRKKWALELDR